MHAAIIVALRRICDVVIETGYKRVISLADACGDSHSIPTCTGPRFTYIAYFENKPTAASGRHILN